MNPSNSCVRSQQFSIARRSGRRSRAFAGTFLATLLVCLFTGTALAQTGFTEIYHFTGFVLEGSAAPTGDLVMDSNGSVFGVTNPAPNNGHPEVFALTPPTFGGGTWTYQNLLQTRYTHFSLLTLGNAGELYVAESNCASTDFGCVLQLVPPAIPGGSWTTNIIHHFQGSAQGDGALPALGKLAIDASGNLYGVTQATANYRDFLGGTIYQLSPPVTPGGAWTEQILYRFSVAGGFSYPELNVALGANGHLYGSTRKGSFGGVVYDLAPPATSGGPWKMSVIKKGISAKGKISQLTVSPSSTLYGVSTLAHGPFALKPPAVTGGAWTLSLLTSQVPNGGPGMELALNAAGNLFGVNNNQVYKLTPPATSGGAWTYTVLNSPPTSNDGQFLFGRPLLDASGNLFGAFLQGGGSACHFAGVHGCGTVWELQ